MSNDDEAKTKDNNNNSSSKRNSVARRSLPIMASRRLSEEARNRAQAVDITLDPFGSPSPVFSGPTESSSSLVRDLSCVIFILFCHMSYHQQLCSCHESRPLIYLRLVCVKHRF
jgi:hypothetical protein